jgi:hypothetical protein
MSTPNIPDASEAAPAPSPSVSKSASQVSVLKIDLEERSNSDLVDEEEEQPTSSWARTLFGKRTNPLRDPGAIATRRSVFDDPHLAPYYRPKQDYENIHRFDPSARWTYREEKVSDLSPGSMFSRLLTGIKALLRKIDWKIMIMAAVSFSALNLDRSNINQANSANFLSDLHLTTNGDSE